MNSIQPDLLFHLYRSLQKRTPTFPTPLLARFSANMLVAPRSPVLP
jgi:hypothetical protein